MKVTRAPKGSLSFVDRENTVLKRPVTIVLETQGDLNSMRRVLAAAKNDLPVSCVFGEHEEANPGLLASTWAFAQMLFSFLDIKQGEAQGS